MYRLDIVNDRAEVPSRYRLVDVPSGFDDLHLDGVQEAGGEARPEGIPDQL